MSRHLHFLQPDERERLVAIRRALAVPFADPVLIEGRALARREARMMERLLLGAAGLRERLAMPGRAGKEQVPG